METNKYEYLGRVNSPTELKELPIEAVEPLCREIRDAIINTANDNGGHLASNLGAVELSVAIHRVFDCPHDHVIFDVGHQSYTHKLLTGRYSRFDTLRRPDGLSGFTNRDESEYDCFGAGHSSTSLSAALGFAEADRISGSDAYTVVVLGDGAFTGGMIHEALNNCNKRLARLIIILNENEMSISKNIGSFARNLAKLRKKGGYFKAKRFTVRVLKRVPLVGGFTFKAIRRIKKTVKNILYGSNYFEDIGLYYLGPADGNDYESVEELLRVAKSAGESVLVHLKTKKGKGYEPAEASPDEYHGVKPQGSGAVKSSDFSGEMGLELCRLAESDDKICAITAAMSTGTGLDCFAERFKDRFFDVGIAEEHAVTFAAGLCAGGRRGVFAVYSTFLQRGYDQMIHDVALQRLPVVFAIDRAGLNESDGATHHGVFDVAFISQIPGIALYTPVCYEGLRASLGAALASNAPAALRYPSGAENALIKKSFYPDGYDGRITVRSDTSDMESASVVIVTHGRIAAECIRAKEMLAERGVCAAVVLCEYVSPYDKLADEVAPLVASDGCKAILFVEEEIKSGGFGMNLSEEMRTRGYLEDKRYGIAALEDAFVKRGAGGTFLASAKLDAQALADRAETLLR